MKDSELNVYIRDLARDDLEDVATMKSHTDSALIHENHGIFIPPSDLYPSNLDTYTTLFNAEADGESKLITAYMRGFYKDHKLKAFIRFHTEATLPSGKVDDLYVHPDMWKLGVGKALLNNAFKTFKEAGKRVALIDTYADHAGANAFYQKLGGKILKPEVIGSEVNTTYYSFNLEP